MDSGGRQQQAREIYFSMPGSLEKACFQKDRATKKRKLDCFVAHCIEI